MSGVTRPAVIIAASVNLCCPHCGEPQPSPDDSDLWLPAEVKKAEGQTRECVSCDKTFQILFQNRCAVESA